MKNIITIILKSIERLSSRFQLVEEKINKLGDRLSNLKKQEKMKENEQSPREMGDMIKHINVCMKGLTERDKIEKGTKNIQGNNG